MRDSELPSEKVPEQAEISAKEAAAGDMQKSVSLGAAFLIQKSPVDGRNELFKSKK